MKNRYCLRIIFNLYSYSLKFCINVGSQLYIYLKNQNIEIYNHKTKNYWHKHHVCRWQKTPQEIAGMQDFAPFTPELLWALSGPQTPGRIKTCLWQAGCRVRPTNHRASKMFL